MTPGRRGIFVIIICALVTLAVFYPFFTQGHIPMPGSFMVAWYEPWKSDTAKNGVPTIVHKPVGDDVFRQLFPMKALAIASIRAGKLPLWNPYNGAGQPLLANLHPGYLNPFGLLLLINERIGWAWYVILQLPLLFLATYWYGRTIQLSRSAGIIAATILCVSGAVVVRYIYGDYLYALAMLPVLFAATECVRLKKRRWAYIVPPAAAFALISVQPQISLFVVGTALVYAAVRLGRGSIRYGVFALLGVGIAAVQLVPTIELWREANVTAASSAFIFERFLMQISHFVSLLIPNYFGNAGTYNFWGQTDYVETAVFIGFVPVFLAAVAWFTRNKTAYGRIVSFLLWGSVVSLALSLNWFLPKMLIGLKLPIFATSIPTRVYLLTSFFLSILAGIGVDALTKTRSRRSILRVFWAIALIILGGTILAYIRKWPCPSVMVAACRMVALRNTLVELAGFALFSMVLFIPDRKKNWGILAIIGLVGIYNAYKFLPFSPPEHVMPPHPRIAEFQARAPNRVALFGDDAIATDLATYYKFFDPNYYDPLYLRRYGELVSYVNTGDRTSGLTRSDVEIIRDATVSAGISFRRQRFFDLVGAGKTALPRAYFVSDYEVQDNPDRILDLLYSVDFDPRSTVVLETSIPGELGASAETDRAEIRAYDADKVGIATRTENSRLLVLSDNYYSGWKAFVDNQEVPVYRANYAFRAIIVPAGAHTVQFTYEPESVRIGGIVSAIATVALVLVIVIPRVPSLQF